MKLDESCPNGLREVNNIGIDIIEFKSINIGGNICPILGLKKESNKLFIRFEIYNNVGKLVSDDKRVIIAYDNFLKKNN